jgi:hypothetical protein
MLPASVRYLAIVSGCCCAVFFSQPLAADDVHPLQAALELCESSHREMMRTIADYEATLVKRERLNGQLRDREVMRIKVRHENKSAAGKEIPFSVHIQFRHPESAKGREVTYVVGRNRGQLIVREGRQGLVGKLVPTLMLNPQGRLAMQGNRYPVTEIGFEVLLRRLMVVAREEMKLGNCQVQFRQEAKVNGRSCTVIEVIHPEQDERFRYHRCRIYLDDERKCPIHFEAFGWPASQGAEPPLLEQYTYLDVKTNVGLTDADFKLKD